MRSRLFYGPMIYKCGKSVDISASYPHSFLLMHIFVEVIHIFRVVSRGISMLVYLYIKTRHDLYQIIQGVARTFLKRI